MQRDYTVLINMTILYLIPYLGYTRALNLGKKPPEGRYASKEQQQQSQNLGYCQGTMLYQRLPGEQFFSCFLPLHYKSYGHQNIVFLFPL